MDFENMGEKRTKAQRVESMMRDIGRQFTFGGMRQDGTGV